MTQRTGFPGRTVGCLLALALAGCGGSAEPPGPGTSQGVPPDLRGSRVMVFPIQIVSGVQGDPDAELAFGLEAREPAVEWLLPAELERALARSPSVRSRTRGLSVTQFLAAEVRRVGDPLFGELIRLGALVNGEVALLPVRMWPGEVVEGGVPVRLSAALIHVRTGRVVWFGVVEGEAAEPGDPQSLASAVDALARTLLWYSTS